METYKQDDSDMHSISEDTKEYFEKLINEAINDGATGEKIRHLFATNLLTKRVGHPYELTRSFLKLLGKDVLETRRKRSKCPGMILDEEQLWYYVWFEIGHYICDLEFYLKINHGMRPSDVNKLPQDVKDNIEYLLEISYQCGASGSDLRQVFADFVKSEFIKDPVKVWNLTWNMLTKDVLRNQRIKSKNPSLWMNEDEQKSVAWMEIEKLIDMNEIDGANIANA